MRPRKPGWRPVAVAAGLCVLMIAISQAIAWALVYWLARPGF